MAPTREGAVLLARQFRRIGRGTRVRGQRACAFSAGGPILCLPIVVIALAIYQ